MSRRPLVFLLFGLLAAVLLAWLRMLLAGESLFWGLPSLQFYPWRVTAFEQIRAGHVPLWNPYNGGGAPLLANYQTAVLYPPNWLHLLISHVAAMNILAVGHIFWAAIGMWLFTGTCSMSDFGRAVSTLSFALGGYLIARLGSFPTVACASWLPWLLFAVHQFVEQRTLRRMFVITVVSAMLLLAGHAQTTSYVLVAAGAYTVTIASQQTRSRDLVRTLVIVTLAGLLGAGLAAPQLVPTFDLLSKSSRSNGLDYDWTVNFSYSLARALTLLIPNLYGTPADGSYITEGVYFEDAAYIGLLPLLGAGAAGLQWLRMRRSSDVYRATSMVPFWMLMAMVSFLIALGKNGFLFPLLYRYVPGFTSFQAPVRWLIVTVFALCTLAGTGVSAGWHKGRWTVFWSRLTLAGGIGMVMTVALVAPRLVPDDLPAVHVMSRSLMMFGLLLSASAALTLLQPRSSNGWRAVWQALVLVFIAADLFVAFRGLNPTVPSEFFEQVPTRQQPAALLYMPEDMERHLKFEQYFPPNDYRVAVERWRELRESLLPNLNMLDQVPMVNNFDPIVTQAYTDSVVVIEEGVSANSQRQIVAVGSMSRQSPFGQRSFILGVVVALATLTASLGVIAAVPFGRFKSRRDNARMAQRL